MIYDTMIGFSPYNLRIWKGNVSVTIVNDFGFFFFFMKKDITRNILDELIASNVIYVCRIYDKILIQLFLRRIWFS